MSKSHNKKRNAGLLYEFLGKTISSSLVEGNKKRSSAALKILKKHFRPGTELYKELRLVNALMRSTVSVPAVASSILSEAKAAARSHDVAAIDKEKSMLIRSINHTLQDDSFYDQQVNEYKMYATVQTLINDWRSTNPDLQRLAEYEDRLHSWLVSQKDKIDSGVIGEETNGTSRLLMKVMTKKLNDKYSGILNEDQRSLVKAYAFAAANENDEFMIKKLNEIKTSVILEIDNQLATSTGNEYTDKKLVEARDMLLSESIDNVSDELIARFMLYTRLGSELKAKE